jgi:hypothetical protein
MKIQDIFFLITLISFLYKRKPGLLVWAGLICLVFAFPLFLFWIFFTAQRLVMYAFAFFVIWAIITSIKSIKDTI